MVSSLVGDFRDLLYWVWRNIFNFASKTKIHAVVEMARSNFFPLISLYLTPLVSTGKRRARVHLFTTSLGPGVEGGIFHWSFPNLEFINIKHEYANLPPPSRFLSKCIESAYSGPDCVCAALLSMGEPCGRSTWPAMGRWSQSAVLVTWDSRCESSWRTSALVKTYRTCNHTKFSFWFTINIAF